MHRDAASLNRVSAKQQCRKFARADHFRGGRTDDQVADTWRSQQFNPCEVGFIKEASLNLIE